MKYRKIKRYKYELLDDFSIELGFNTGLCVKTEWIQLDGSFLRLNRGYCWDGASGPAKDTDTFMLGSLVHDALYQLMRLGMLPIEYRLPADIELKRLCGQYVSVYKDGKLMRERVRMNPIRQMYTYRAVRHFGGVAMRTGTADDAIHEIVFNVRFPKEG